MYDEADIVKKDVNGIIETHGLSSNEFKITVEIGSSYAPMQIVGSQVWITVERNAIKKKYGLYLKNWPDEIEADLKNGYFNK